MSTLSTTNLKNPSSVGNNIVLNTDGSSTLITAKITTLADSNGANTSTPEAIANGTCKAWVNFNGTLAAANMIRASYNVSSITDNGTGDYTVNFATAMADANYALVGFATRTTNETIVTGGAAVSFTISSARIGTRGGGGGLNDSENVHVAIFR